MLLGSIRLLRHILQAMLKGPLLWLANYKKSLDTKISRLQAPKSILDDVDPNIDTVMIFWTHLRFNLKNIWGVSLVNSTS
jgi:hypothetical protein